MKFSTWTMALFGSTIRKYATALTRTGTLSLVITSCGGMLSVIVRRSTFTIRSMIGISRKRPGPFGAGNSRPSRKTIPRSYRRSTLPELTVDENHAGAAVLADLADDRVRANGHRRAANANGFRDREYPGTAENECDRDQQRRVRVVWRGGVPEQHQRADHEAD